MILKAAHWVSTSDRESYAWANLRKFQNIDLVESRIVALHSLNTQMKRNARKQARQLRYCLIQAREYFAAAKAVSLATKPTLQYYGVMCLALAEILLKQTGDSSLDRARQFHKHHGLLFRERTRPRNDSLTASAGALVANPHIDPSGHRNGTFELWHRSARESLLAGTVTQQFGGGISTGGCGIILAAADTPLQPLPAAGISLLQCLQSLPGMFEHLPLHGVAPETFRARLDMDTFPPPNERQVIRVTLHPSDITSRFLESTQVEAGWVDRIQMREAPFGGGAIIEILQDPINGAARFRFPHGSQWTDQEVRFWPSDQPLNEFGFLYVALYIAGNYSRYFPDKWLLDVETSAPLAVVIEELTELADWRAPWLCLNELAGVCFAPVA